MDINLAAVEDINRVIHQIKEAGYDIAPDQFYDRMLLDSIKLGMENYVHLSNTENFTLPVGTKKLQKRRWGGLTAHTTPLLEGIPPHPDKTSMEAITFTATAFGRYMEFTDRVNLDQIDPQIAHYTKELGDVMVRTLERYARETLLASASKLFANNRLNVGELVIGDKIAIEDLRFQALRMRRLLVKAMPSGYFNYICSPEFLYDLIDDPLVDKYMTVNQTTKQLFDDGKPFPMFTIKFIQTMLDEHYTPDLDHVGEWYDGLNSKYKLRVYGDFGGVWIYGNIAEGNIVDNDAAVARTTASSVVYLDDGTAITGKVSWNTNGYAASVTAGANVTAKTAWGAFYYTYVHTGTVYTLWAKKADGTFVELGTVINAVLSSVTVAAAIADAAGDTDGTFEGISWFQLPVHKGILYGKEGLVKISISGQDKPKTIIKPLGSAGSNDPLNQRQTIGAKINSIGYGLLRDEAVVVTYSVPAQAVYTSGLTAAEVKMANGVTHSGVSADNAAAELEYREYTVDPQALTNSGL